MELLSLIKSVLDPRALILWGGYAILFAIVFAESGLFFGFFLPGDSLLFTAGFLASQKDLGTGLDIMVLIPLLIVAAISGDQVGYYFGKRVGRPLFNREDSLLFKKKHLIKAEEFFEKHGGKAIILARFLPAVRTFVPIVAGVAQMNYRKFVTYNVLGGLLWVIGLTLGGYTFGRLIPDVDRYLIPVVLLIIIVSVMPTAIHLWRESRNDIWRLVQARVPGLGPRVPAPESE